MPDAPRDGWCATASLLAPKVTFGRKGAGPRDFKHLPFVFVQAESLVCRDFTKVLWFSRKGEVLRAMPFPALEDLDLSPETLPVPARGHFRRITADHAQFQRRLCVVDSRFTTIKMLCEGPLVWMEGSRTDDRTDTVASGGLAFAAGTPGAGCVPSLPGLRAERAALDRVPGRRGRAVGRREPDGPAAFARCSVSSLCQEKATRA